MEEANHDSTNAIRVCLRIRPLGANEAERGDTSSVTSMPDLRTVKVTIERGGKMETQFHKFDCVFGEETTQIGLFHKSGVEAYCEAACEGYASTIFCFGQTGSGKTFTMSGPTLANNAQASDVDTIGIQYRAVHFIWSKISEIIQRESIRVKASFIEIYNEQVNDLLNNTTNLKVRWSQPSQSFFVEQLMLVTCDSLDDLLAVLEEGANNRKRASHLLNVDSSRSHTIFTLYVERHVGEGTPPRMGKINFVDLAGSERLKESGSSGTNAVETKSINKSLFALCNVISCLSSSKRTSTFIPYRDSKLTELLMDTLGGGCRTLMIACVTPSNYFVEETLRTLKYAARAGCIINSTPAVRTDPHLQLVFDLRCEVEMLRKENAALRAQLEARSPQNVRPPPVVPSARANLPRIDPQNVAFPLSLAPSQSRPEQNEIPHLVPTPDITPLTTQSLAALQVAEKVRTDNERLRDEVAQLRSMVLESRASSTRLEHTASSLQNPSNALEFGFRPVPKKSHRLSLIPIALAGATNGTSASAPLPGDEDKPFDQTSHSFLGRPLTHDAEDVAEMRLQLESAKKELMLLRADTHDKQHL